MTICRVYQFFLLEQGGSAEIRMTNIFTKTGRNKQINNGTYKLSIHIRTLYGQTYERTYAYGQIYKQTYAQTYMQTYVQTYVQPYE